ncbi:MAG TPA: ABC transporter substrate-binding protein [Desulfobacteraceae bacterium]|nr:ABC transporter substrate-binding protein [Desulfobacteraceae bacterium]
MKRTMLFILSVMLLAPQVFAETITVCSYGGTYNQAIEKVFAEPFTRQTGIKVVTVSFPNYAKMKAQVASGNIEWDVVEPSIKAYALGVKDGLFEPLDLSGVDTKDFIKTGVTDFGLATIYYSHNVTYRTDVWPKTQGPKNWADVWDVQRFPGPRGMKYTAYSNLEAALLADGVPPNKIYPIDVDRAFKKMDELKPYIKVFWKNGAQGQQVMKAHEADTGSFTAGRMQIIAEQGVPVTCEWNQQIVDLDYLCILKGSRHKDAATQFIRFTAAARRQAEFAMLTNYGPANTKAYDFIPEDKAKDMPTYKNNMKTAVTIDGNWYAEHGKEVAQRWEAWKMN